MTHSNQPYQSAGDPGDDHPVGRAGPARPCDARPQDQIRKLTDEQVQEAFGAVEFMAQHAGEMLGRLRARPEQRELSGVEMEFGLGFNSELKVYIVGAKAEASLKVKLTWKADGA